jgi:hypothetical protein
VTANDDMKPGMVGLVRLGAGIPARAIQPEAGAEALVKPMLPPAGVSEPAALSLARKRWRR